MAKYTGKNLAVRWHTGGGTVTVTSVRRSFETSESQDDADATAGTQTYRDHLSTFTDMTSTLEYLDQNNSAGSTIFEGFVPGTEGTVEWSPNGTASGNEKELGTAYVASRDKTMPYDDVIAVTIGFQHTAAPTRSEW